MAGLEGIRACVFDAYGTLFDVNSPVQKLAAEIGDKADELARLWRQKQLEYTWLRSLMGVHADFWHVTGDALDYSLEALKIEDPGPARRIDDALSEARCLSGCGRGAEGRAGQGQAHGNSFQWQPLHAGQCGARRRTRKNPSTWFCRWRMWESTSRAGGSTATPCRNCKSRTRRRSALSPPTAGTRRRRRSSGFRSSGWRAAAGRTTGFRGRWRQGLSR